MNTNRRALLGLSPVLLLAIAIGASGCAMARAYVPPLATTANGQFAALEIYDRSSGATLDIYGRDGQRYVVGAPGAEYRLRLRNVTGGRILVVGSIDGVNIISGETAAPNQSGYVLGPWESVDVDGWRTSFNQTAAFYFTDLGNSYAARTGRAIDVGVIGLAVFQERPRVAALPQPRIALADKAAAPAPWADTPAWRGDAAGPAPERAAADARSRTEDSVTPPSQAPAASPGEVRDELRGGLQESAPRAMAKENAGSGMLVPNAPPAAKLGTGYGRTEQSNVRRVDFERATVAPAEVLAVRYDRRENLVAMGVIPEPRMIGRAPDPFPGMRFAPAPR